MFFKKQHYQVCDIYLSGSNEAIFSDVRIPHTFYQKAKGLLGERELEVNSGMLFKNCNSIHMMGMKIPLDIVFLSKDNLIIKYVEHIKPWRITGCSKGLKTLELSSGAIKLYGLKIGMRLEIKE